jgi:antitoxin component YwqK of YwqJK toxin-antitoxin module
MKKLLSGVLFFCQAAAAQVTGTERLVFYNMQFYPCTREEAFYAGIAYESNELTEVILYHHNRQKALTGSYLDKELQKRHGAFTWYDTNGARISVCLYKKNIPHGIYLSWFSNNSLRDSGQFKKGHPDGLWKQWYPDGGLKSACYYDADKLADYMETYRAKMFSPYQPRSSNPQRIAPPVPVSRAQDVSGQTTRFGNRSAYNNTVDMQRQYDLIFNPEENEKDKKANKKDVVHTSVEDSLYLSRISYMRCYADINEAMYDGIFISYHSNGQVKDSGYYRGGLKNGVWLSWYDNGKRQSMGRFENGIPVKDWKIYDDNGSLLYVRTYKPNGRLANEVKIKD